jgi:hypothetical protein
MPPNGRLRIRDVELRTSMLAGMEVLCDEEQLGPAS